MRLLPRDRSLGWTRYVWLIYVVFLFVQPGITGSARDWITTSLAVAAFLPLYFLGFWLQGRKVLWVVGGMLVIGVLIAPINAGGACFFIYAASFLGQAVRPATGIRLLLAIVALLALEAWLIGIPRFGWVWGGIFTLIVGGVNIHFAEVSRNQAKLRLAHDEVERLATMAERERIARDLHDVLGHTLSLITIKAGLAGRLVETDPAAAGREVAELEAISREALAEVRRTVAGYRHLSLGAEIAKAKVALVAAGVELEATTGPYDLDGETESAVALALREGVTNIVRHAEAGLCQLRLRQRPGEFRLEIIDDGRGGEEPEGSGLAGMRERIEALAGTVERDGSKGTHLTVVVPLGPERANSSRTAAAQ